MIDLYPRVVPISSASSRFLCALCVSSFSTAAALDFQTAPIETRASQHTGALIRTPLIHPTGSTRRTARAQRSDAQPGVLRDSEFGGDVAAVRSANLTPERIRDKFEPAKAPFTMNRPLDSSRTSEPAPQASPV